MKSEPLLLSAIHFIEKSLVNSATLNSEIIGLANPENEMYYTPGSAVFAEEYLDGYWNAEFELSFPGKIDEEKADQIMDAAAVVLFTETSRIIVLHKNDVFSNAPLRPEIKSSLQKTVVHYGIKSLSPL